MRQLHHFSRKRRMLKYRLKQFRRAASSGNIAVQQALAEEIRGLLRYVNRSLIRKIATAGLLFLLAGPVKAQNFAFLDPVWPDSVYNLFPLQVFTADTVNGSPFVINTWDGIMTQREFIDIDQDGDIDLLYTVRDVCHYYCDVPLWTAIFYQENTSNPSQRFADPELVFYSNKIFHNVTYGSMNAGDLDGDGDADIVIAPVSRGWNNITLLLENVATVPGSFELSVRDTTEYLPLGAFTPSADLYDIDDDGDLDLVTVITNVNYTAWQLAYNENTADGGFAVFADSIIRTGPDLDLPYADIERLEGDLMIQDIDGDGLDDLVMSVRAREDDLPEPSTYDYEMRLLYFSNTGDPGMPFSGPPYQLAERDVRGNGVPTDNVNTYTRYAVVDLDEDGDTDLFEYHFASSDGCGYCPVNYSFGGIYFHENVYGQTALMTGTLYKDLNLNGIRDNGELPAAGISVQRSPDGMIHVTNADGEYYFYTDAGTYQLGVLAPHPNWTGFPVQQEITLDSLELADSIDFALQPLTAFEDLRITAVPPTRVRPGWNVNYRLMVTNLGSGTAMPVVSAALSEFLTYTEAFPPATTVTADTLCWSLPVTEPLQTTQISLWLQVSTEDSWNELAVNHYAVFPQDADIDLSNNTFTTQNLITGSYDPNDKSVYPSGDGPEGAVPPDTDLFTYTIRFQNVGNDTAFQVVVNDTIDSDLDPLTFRMVAASHDYDFELLNHVATWSFDDILLPDSTTDQEASNGYIQYDIRPYPEQPIGTHFTNAADIYFDFNDPVRTNQTLNTFAITLGLGIDHMLEFKLYPNPAGERAVLEFPNEHRDKATLEVYSQDGRLIWLDEVYDESFEIRRGDLPTGIYSFRVRVNGLEGAGKLVIGR